ncbi:MAG: phage major capsid protein [Caulobacteraceae bacterium]|nr:phage major capsid protein [Caulobacteraceae bacterium]
MSKALQLRQKAGELLNAWQKAMELRDGTTDVEQRKAKNIEVETAKAAYDQIQVELRDAESMEAAQTAAAGEHARTQRSVVQPGPAGGELRDLNKIRQQYSMVRAMRMASQGKQLEGLEAEMFQEADREARAAGISLNGTIRIPNIMQPEQRADLAVGTNSAGGFTVATEIGQLINILEPQLVTRKLGATYLTGLQGNIQFPRNNGDVSSVWEGENTDNDASDVTFDTVTLSPKRLGSFVIIGKQLIAQSSVSIENLVRSRMNFSIAKAVDTAAINGSGSSNQPTGILNTSGIGSVAIGANGGVPTFANIVDLETAVAVANADMGRLAYLTTSGIRGKLKQTEKTSTSTAQFIWTDTMGPTGRQGELNGLNAFTSSLVPSTLTKGTASAICHAILFGNFEDLLIGQWAGLDLTLDNITLAGKAQIKLIINSWWDVAVRQPASFAAIKDAKLS